MRTTVTLDPDVRRMLEEVVKQRGIPFKQALTDAIRAGLDPAGGHKRHFVQKPYSMGKAYWDKALAMSDAIGDEESMRKLEPQR